ncbi:MAG TPA: family 16 glycosylhydrolase [Polyangiaceae bacterium]
MKQLGLAARIVPALLTLALPARAVSSAELYQNSAEYYGRFEARIRFAPGDGVVSSFFLWKSGSEASGAYWNELDFEKLGADCHMQTNAIFGAPNVGHPQVNTVAGDLCGAYHTYGFEWAPTYISWQIDGSEVRRDTGATATAFAQNASAGMQIHFNVWPGDATFGGNFSPAILPVYQYVSWVQYSTYTNGSFSVAWREEFDGGGLPSGWATGNWASPKNNSTHSPANVNFVNGISILSLTSDTATGFTGVPPADGSGGSSGAAGTGGMPTAGTAGAGTSGSGGSSSGSGGSSSGSSGAAAGGESAGTGAGGTSGTNDGGVGGASGTNGGVGGTGAGGTSGASGTNAAGSPVSGGSGGSQAPSDETAPAKSTGSCACRLPSTPQSSVAPALLSLLALAALGRRRRSAKLTH